MKFPLLGLLFQMLMLYASSIHAFVGVTIVYNGQTSAYQTFVKTFSQELELRNPHVLRVKEVNLEHVDRLVVSEESDLVIALGEDALIEASKLRFTTPVIGVFVARTSFGKLQHLSLTRNAENFSLILTEQPFARQVALAKLTMPKIHRVGLLLGPTSAWNSDSYKQELQTLGLESVEARVTDATDLIPNLNGLLKQSDALLAVPDALVYSKGTAQPILLTAYRHQKPVFGYSYSYVKAGALAAVYSTTEQFAKQAVEIALAIRKTPNAMPPPQYPKYFSVAVNRQVARTLGLTLQAEAEIHQKVHALENRLHE